MMTSDDHQVFNLDYHHPAFSGMDELKGVVKYA